MNKSLNLAVVYTCISVCFSLRISTDLMADIVDEVSSVYNTKCIEILMHQRQTQEEWAVNEKLLKLLSSRKIAKVYDMDKYDMLKSEEDDLSKTKCFRPIRVTIGNELSQIPFQKVSFWYGNTISKPVSLVFLNMSMEAFFQNASLPYNLIIIGVKMVAEDLIEMYEIYRVAFKFPMHMDLVGDWTMKSGLNLTRRTVFARRYDFEGKLFRTGSIEKWPFSTFNGYLEKNESWDGLYCAVWKELGKLLNFKTEIHRGDIIGISGRTPGVWSGLIKNLTRGMIDVIVADARLTMLRLNILDFTYPLTSSWYQIYYKQPGYRLRWSAVFEPFNYDVWVAILLWVLIGGVCFYVCFHLCVIHGLEPEDRHDFSFSDSFFFMLGTLSSQDYSRVPNTLVCRVIFLMAYIAAAVLIPAYSASVISFLSQHTPKRPFDSLEGLLKDGTYKIIVEANTTEYAYFARATNPLLKEISEKLVQPIVAVHYKNYSSNTLEMLCRNEKLALFDVEQFIKMKNTAELSCKLLTLTQSLTKVDNAFAFAKGDPYAMYIHHHIHRMTEAGLIRRIQHKMSPKMANHPAPLSPVQLDEVFQIFSFLLLGIIISVLIFFAELGYTNYRKKGAFRGKTCPKVPPGKHQFIL